MLPELLCDSDVIIKLCIYGLEVWREGGALSGRRVGTLAASRFIIPRRIGRSRTVGPKDKVRASWASFEAAVQFLEPSETEILVAAELEAFAQRGGFAFDTGESLLLAILVARGCELLITGDKRAVIALHHLRGAHTCAANALRRVACLEQLVSHLLEHEGGEAVRNCVCREPTTDTALTICFRCASSPADDAAYQEGLRSYIEDLRRSSGDVMSDAPPLSVSVRSTSSA